MGLCTTDQQTGAFFLGCCTGANVLKASSFNREVSYSGSLLSSIFSITNALHMQARKELTTSSNCEPMFLHLCAYMNELSPSTRTNSHLKNKSKEFHNEHELDLTTTQKPNSLFLLYDAA